MVFTGEDFDQRIMEYFIKLIKKKYSKDISKDKRALGKLRREAERAKRALSNQHQVCSHLVLDDTTHIGRFLILSLQLYLLHCALSSFKMRCECDVNVPVNLG